MGYSVLKLKNFFQSKGKEFPKWMATNWGSDLYLYSNQKEHKPIIQNLLNEIDYYDCESQRDLDIAVKKFKMDPKKQIFPIVPNNGGFDIHYLEKLRKNFILPSKRKLILIKGYQHFAGRALTALKVIEECTELLMDYEIHIINSMLPVIKFAEFLGKRTGLKIICHDIKNYLPHEKILKLQMQARVYMGISISDGLSISALEAMAMGAFPIQTDTSTLSEWLENGKSGFIVPHEDEIFIVKKFKEALKNDVLVDRAAEINWGIIKERANKENIAKQIIPIYKKICSV